MSHTDGTTTIHLPVPLMGWGWPVASIKKVYWCIRSNVKLFKKLDGQWLSLPPWYASGTLVSMPSCDCGDGFESHHSESNELVHPPFLAGQLSGPGKVSANPYVTLALCPRVMVPTTISSQSSGDEHWGHSAVQCSQFNLPPWCTPLPPSYPL